ncbi:MAG: adenosylcobinamide-GDP ribazoletransferase [Lentisphaeraceae bacterium]|nr:adenosylcobinamide-GDP ribazoletransferase [Lentisphaeraceae bacterium]
MLSREIKIFLTALTFFTRIPSPKYDFKDEYLENCGRYFPLIGLIIGSLSFLPYYFATPYFSQLSNLSLMLVASVILTGAFHEDGLADMADGLGGGWTKEQKLKIMKDSRIGTYGTVSLILLFLLKISLLWELSSLVGPGVFFLIYLAGHSLSRLNAGLLMYFMPYVQESDSAKSKPVAQMSKVSLATASIIGISPLFLLQPGSFYLVIPLLVTLTLLALFFKKQLGGITGDCLGGCQQISELVIIASSIVLLLESVM